jgi:hypothetical protein
MVTCSSWTASSLTLHPGVLKIECTGSRFLIVLRYEPSCMAGADNDVPSRLAVASGAAASIRDSFLKANFRLISL